VGIDDKIRNEAEEMKGKAKEAAGDLTDKEKLQAEGKADQASAKTKKMVDETGDRVDDALR
jgi:uncharacterized protein YjbJ (UPF0337 family)